MSSSFSSKIYSGVELCRSCVCAQSLGAYVHWPRWFRGLCFVSSPICSDSYPLSISFSREFVEPRGEGVDENFLIRLSFPKLFIFCILLDIKASGNDNKDKTDIGLWSGCQQPWKHNEDKNDNSRRPAPKPEQTAL